MRIAFLSCHTENMHPFFAVLAAVQKVNQTIDFQDKEALLAALRLPALGILSILEANSQCYLEQFTSYRDHKAKVRMAIKILK